MDEFLLLQRLEGQAQSGREGGLASHGDIGQGALRKLHRVGRGQDGQGAVLLEDDQADAITALVGIGQQRQDGAFGRRHAFGDRHRPGGVDDEQDQVGSLANAYLALQIGSLDGEGDPTPLFLPADLVGRSGPQRGVKGDVRRDAVGRAGGDVAAALAVGARLGAAAAHAARDAVELALEPTRLERLAGLDLLAAFPPVGLERINWRLRRRFGQPAPLLVLARLAGYATRLTFFLSVGCSSVDGSDS